MSSLSLDSYNVEDVFELVGTLYRQFFRESIVLSLVHDEMISEYVRLSCVQMLQDETLRPTFYNSVVRDFD